MSDQDKIINFRTHIQTINELFDFLQNNDELIKNVLIKGVSGTGKSFIATEIANRWNSYSDDHLALYLKGDITFSHRNYYPWINSITNLKKDKKVIQYVPKSAIELSKGIPVAGDFVSYILETFTSTKQAKQQYGTRYLNDIEKNLIYDINSLFNDRKLLIVIDNLNWLDSESLSFLNLLIKSDILYYYPNFEFFKFLLVFTEDQEIISEALFKQVVTRSDLFIIKTSVVSIEEYKSTLNFFGVSEELPSGIINVLYSFTGGHLALIKKLAEYLSEKKSSAFSIIHSIENTSDPAYQFIEELLLYKLSAMGASGEQIAALMEFAAVIGLTFSKDELICVSQEKEQTVKEIINAAQAIELISEEESRQRFAHEILRYFFLNRSRQKKYAYNQAFADCLSKLRPSDYFTRANCLFEAGDTTSASTIYILGVLKNLREGIAVPPGAIARIESFASEFDIVSYLGKMIKAYDLYSDTQYQQSIDILEIIEDWLPRQLLAEKAYLIALCLTKTMFKDDLEKALSYLTGWDELKGCEGEIWIRLMTLQMTVNINLYNFEEAKGIEKSIIFYLSDRIKFDPTVKYKLNVIRRNAMAAHINEIACLRTKQSVDFFSSKENKLESAYPIQLYYSLNNHAANLIVAGEWNQAFEYTSKAVSFIKSSRHIHFPESQILINNYIISGILSHTIPTDQAVNMFKIISPYRQFVADELLIKNNYAVVLLYENEIEKALKILAEINSFCKNKNVDPYYTYLIGCNYYAAQYIKGDDIDFGKCWNNLLSVIPIVPDYIYLKKRHELIMANFDQIEKSPLEWNGYLYKHFPNVLGKSWKYYSQGFLLSDIQLWYES